jgi:hypothetical protein
VLVVGMLSARRFSPLEVDASWHRRPDGNRAHERAPARDEPPLERAPEAIETLSRQPLARRGGVGDAK